MSYVMLILIGLVGGVVSSVFGVGGGTIFVPALVLILSYNPHLAIGTSLAVVVPTAIAGAFFHGRAEMVDWKAALVIAGVAILGAWVGTKISLKLDAVLLRRCFSIFLVLVAIKMFFQPPST